MVGRAERDVVGVGRDPVRRDPRERAQDHLRCVLLDAPRRKMVRASYAAQSRMYSCGGRDGTLARTRAATRASASTWIA